jgi:hypothetical protein
VKLYGQNASEKKEAEAKRELHLRLFKASQTGLIISTPTHDSPGRPMNAFLRRRLHSIFADGTAEELATVLQLVHLISAHSMSPLGDIKSRQNSEAAVDFHVHGGGCELSDEESKLK